MARERFGLNCMDTCPSGFRQVMCQQEYINIFSVIPDLYQMLALPFQLTCEPDGVVSERLTGVVGGCSIATALDFYGNRQQQRIYIHLY